ncbi:MAG: hypothetical protein IAF58_22500 [Leptolyngbya sp.]|nr:hypothetical protein [Candidatus Melainabacteria bacterium]
MKQTIIALKELVDSLHAQGDMMCIARQFDESMPKFAFVFDARNLLDGKPNNAVESACALARHYVDTDRTHDAERILTTLTSYLRENTTASDEQMLVLYEALFKVQDDCKDYTKAVISHQNTHRLRVNLHGRVSREVAESHERGGRLYEHYSEAKDADWYSFEGRCLREQALESLISARDTYALLPDADNDMDRVQNLMHLMAMHLF